MQPKRQAKENLRVFLCDSPVLHILNSRSLSYCTSLVGRIDLPNVTSLVASSFSNSPGITELHFGAANEEAIKALPAWTSTDGKFGAVNATVSFDL